MDDSSGPRVAVVGAGPAGFYADLSINANYNLAIVSLNGDFFTKVWLIPDPNAPLESELGAFAEISLSAEVPGASVNATANGTFITRNGQLSLYAMALAEVEVVFVGSAEIGVYADFRNGELYDAGILNEVDGAFAELLADAAAEADAMNAQAENARSAVEGAQEQFDPSLDDETLTAAGVRFQELQNSGLGRLLSIGVAGVVSMYESYLFSPSSISSIPSAWQWVNQSVIHADDRPSRQSVQSAETRMASAIDGATATSAAVISQLQDTRAQAIEWQRTGEVALQAIESPVQSVPVEAAQAGEALAEIRRQLAAYFGGDAPVTQAEIDTFRRHEERSLPGRLDSVRSLVSEIGAMVRHARLSQIGIRQDGLRRVLAGDTTLEEVLRVTRED